MPLTISQFLKKIQTSQKIYRVWEKFGEIAAIPRASGEEAEIRNYLKKFATDRNFKYEIDEAGNILIEITATQGMANTPGVILQAHMDMVCVHDAGFDDPAIKGVKPLIDATGEWIYAQGTSLGADNGIGLAIALALVDDENFKHGPLKIMATVSEESGLAGALKISFRDLDTGNDKYLINLDSEVFGQTEVGCAGAGDSLVSLPIRREPIGNKSVLGLKLTGLMGGHSGMVIGESRINAIKEFANALFELKNTIEFQLVSFRGGSRRNVIPFEAEAIIATNSILAEDIISKIELLSFIIRDKAINNAEKGASVKHFAIESKETHAINNNDSCALIKILADFPHGVKRWDNILAGLPATSINLATVSTDNEMANISLMGRSSINNGLNDLRTEIEMISKIYGATVSHNDSYPQWNPDFRSKILAITKSAYLELFGQEIKVVATHCGLECGAIARNIKFLKIDAISIGPTILDPHSTQEKVNIKSVAAIYNLMKKILNTVSENNI